MMSRNPLPLRCLAILLGAFFLIAACRAGDFVAQYTSRPTVSAAKIQTTKTHTPEAPATETEVPTETAASAGIESLPEMDVPTETEAPTETQAPVEMKAPTDTEVPGDFQGPVIDEPPQPIQPEEPTETAAPKREFEFAISTSWCGPNRGGTFIEGTVYRDGERVDGLLVRLSVNPGGDPIVNDYRTGTDSTKPGGYTQIIGARGPRGGLWYIWLLDPQTKQRISDIATVKTDPTYVEDTDQTSGSCQSAVVDFANDPSTAPVPVQLESPYPTDTSEPTETTTP